MKLRTDLIKRDLKISFRLIGYGSLIAIIISLPYITYFTIYGNLEIGQQEAGNLQNLLSLTLIPLMGHLMFYGIPYMVITTIDASLCQLFSYIDIDLHKELKNILATNHPKDEGGLE